MELINKITEEHKKTDQSHGWNINKRISLIAKHVIEEYDGDIIEIGAGHGNTTAKLLKLGRKVIVIDPFEGGHDYINNKYPHDSTTGEGAGQGFIYPYDEFRRNCGNPDNLILIKECSQTLVWPSNSGQYDWWAGIAFAFVDGLQMTSEDVYLDLVLVESMETKVICVDDVFSSATHRAEVVHLAVSQFLEKYNYILVNLNEEYPNVRECYLIRTDK